MGKMKLGRFEVLCGDYKSGYENVYRDYKVRRLPVMLGIGVSRWWLRRAGLIVWNMAGCKLGWEMVVECFWVFMRVMLAHKFAIDGRAEREVF